MSIQLTDIVKRFKKDLVLDGVSLDIPTGETLVLFGPSGAGKTVLLRLIAGVIDPEEGSIALRGQDMAGVEPEDRGIGMAFQNFALFPHMDAHENIASPLTARQVPDATLKERVFEVAHLLKIDHVLGHKPKELSNGQKQRTALARALAAQPSILLLDDPLRNVDAKLRFEMRLELPRLLREQNATVIYVTQDYKEAMALGDRIAVMSDRGIAQVGTPEEIYLSPANTQIARLFGDPAINLLDVTVQAGPKIALSGAEVVLDAAHTGAVGQDCILGIRPEAIKFVPADAPGAFPVEIEAETPLNEKTVTLAATQAQREILISRPAGTPGPVSGTAHIAMDASGALLFDRASGALLPMAGKAIEGEVA
ncbi:putative erythritol ABC transporter 1, ATP-binding component 1 [Candidatus Rhodobacter oscarellae]|uniref:Putative erythritol ABC transporter 1, ATP-binding component 1 n=1 Tax=Candidatus Rhodobacter oscarellae TaxID=1675527 RepID=A0A0J9E2Z7_9RHOB|nr:ABC transporter ATP-binding protein [Candidatus Rhodobacter lobularis]KMW56154.1 putative erythritol ABC transporter 1, ATP-binding component 1 [Candidatus Rhodobacter lobularis]